MRPLFRLTQGLDLVLASASPRRRQFLSEWGVPFVVRPVEGEPDAVAGESALDFVQRCAAFKMQAARGADREVVVAADTVVALEGRIMGKPADDDEALDMLQALSGRSHQVITAVALSFPDQTSLVQCDTCDVHFAPWSRAVLQAYVATGECSDKAGAYAIQGCGAFLADRIDGCWSTVVGLPVSWLAAELVQRGLLAPLPAGN